MGTCRSTASKAAFFGLALLSLVSSSGTDCCVAYQWQARRPGALKGGPRPYHFLPIPSSPILLPDPARGHPATSLRVRSSTALTTEVAALRSFEPSASGVA